MARALVLTVIGEDRPGLVEALADLIDRHEGSWDESRMARLAGHFAGVARQHHRRRAGPVQGQPVAFVGEELLGCGEAALVADHPPQLGLQIHPVRIVGRRPGGNDVAKGQPARRAVEGRPTRSEPQASEAQ